MSAAKRLATRRVRDDPRGQRVRRLREPAAAARRSRAPALDTADAAPGHRADLRHAAPSGDLRRRHPDRRGPPASRRSIRPCSMRCGWACTSCCPPASPPTRRSTSPSSWRAAPAAAAPPGFANAVLRRVSRDTPGEWMTRVAASARSDDERLGLVFSHPGVGRARVPPGAGRRGARRRARGAPDRRQRVAAGDDGGAARARRGPRGRAAHAVLAVRLPPRRRRPRSGSCANPAGACACRTRARSWPRWPSRRALPVRPGERWLDLCAGPGRQDRGARGRGAAARRPARGERDLARARRARAPGASRACRSRCRCRRRTGACAPGAGALRPHPRGRAVHGPRRAAPAARGALAQVAGRRARADPAAGRAAHRRDRRPRARAASSRTSRARRTSPRRPGVVGEVRREFGERDRGARRARGADEASPMPTRVCRRRTTDPAARSCGRTGTTPTRCRSRCCGASDPRLRPGSASSRRKLGDRPSISVCSTMTAAGWVRASSRASTVMTAACGEAGRDLAQHRQHPLRPGEPQFAAEPDHAAPRRSRSPRCRALRGSRAARADASRIAPTGSRRRRSPGRCCRARPAAG